MGPNKDLLDIRALGTMIVYSLYIAFETPTGKQTKITLLYINFIFETQLF